MQGTSTALCPVQPSVRRIEKDARFVAHRGRRRCFPRWNIGQYRTRRRHNAPAPEVSDDAPRPAAFQNKRVRPNGSKIRNGDKREYRPRWSSSLVKGGVGVDDFQHLAVEHIVLEQGSRSFSGFALMFDLLELPSMLYNAFLQGTGSGGDHVLHRFLDEELKQGDISPFRRRSGACRRAVDERNLRFMIVKHNQIMYNPVSSHPSGVSRTRSGI